MKKLIALALVTLGINVPARAQWIVYDPANTIQSVINTAQEIAKFVEVVNNQVQQIQALNDQLNEFKHYESLFGEPVAHIRRLEDLDSAALTYAEVKAIASGNPLVIEKAQVDAELIRLTRLRSAHAEEQYRIRSNLRRSHEDAEMFTGRLANLQQDISVRQDTSGDNFRIELDGQETNNRGIAGELILRRAEKLKNRFGDDIRIGRFAGFDLFLRPSFNNTVEVVVRGKNSYAARVTDTAQGTIRSLEATVQGFEERAARLETDIADATKRGKELETKVGAHFEREERYQQLTRRQSEIEEKLDLTKNQAPSQVEAESADESVQKISEKASHNQSLRTKRRLAVHV